MADDHKLLTDGEEFSIDGVPYKVSSAMVRGLKKGNKSLGGLAVPGTVLSLGLGGVVLGSYFSRIFRIVALSVIGGLGASFGVALALMKFNKSFSDRMVAKVLPSVMEQMDKSMKKVKMELLKDIKGDVLDFGSGDGQYLHYIALNKDKVKSIVNLEPNKKLHPGINERARQNGVQTEIYSKFAEDLLEERGGNQFDFIIIGNVLCEVPNQASALSSLYRLLRPGGKAFFLEHVAHEKGTSENVVENAVNPVWTIMSGGCNVNRHTLRQIRTLPWDVKSYEFNLKMPIINRLHTGLAVKAESTSRKASL